MNIKDELQEIFRQVFDDNSIAISAETTSDDIDDWDSLTHLQLIVQVEKKFKIKFTTSQIKNMQNVGAMIEIITQNMK